MIEPELLHITRITSVHSVVLFKIRPIFAVVDQYANRSEWKFVESSEEGLNKYINKCKIEQEEEAFNKRWWALEDEESEKTDNLDEAMKNARLRLVEEYQDSRPWLLDAYNGEVDSGT
jgi:hypothetical protein